MVAEHFVWHGLKKQVAQMARNCTHCQASKVQRHVKAPMQHFDPPARRFNHLHVDIVGPLPVSRDTHYLLTVVNWTMRWPEAIPLKDTPAESCARALLANWVTRFSIPAHMTSERGTLANLLGIQLHHTTAYHSQAKGLRTFPPTPRGGSHGVAERSQLGRQEFVDGVLLSLPGEFLGADAELGGETPVLLMNLHNKLTSLTPPPPTHHGEHLANVPKELDSTEFVFIWQGLQHPYEGLYKVLHAVKWDSLEVSCTDDWSCLLLLPLGARGNSSAQFRSLWKVVNIARSITGSNLPSIEDVKEAANIIKDPGHNLFSLMPPGKSRVKRRVLVGRVFDDCCCSPTPAFPGDGGKGFAWGSALCSHVDGSIMQLGAARHRAHATSGWTQRDRAQDADPAHGQTPPWQGVPVMYVTSGRERMAVRWLLSVLAATAVWDEVAGDCGKPPDLENGAPLDEFLLNDSFIVGSKVIYRCNPGYTFRQGSRNSVTCNENVWGQLRATCEPKSCGHPGDILHGYSEGEVTFGNKITFYCDKGYKIVGRNYRTCQADGWDGQVPTCEGVTCPDILSFENGQVSSPSIGEFWQFGEVAEFSCDGDYSLIGARQLTCEADGNWNSAFPVCKVVRCQSPATSENVKIELGFGPTYKYQETITYACKEGYDLVGARVITCGADNRFSPQPPTCELITRCQRPTTSENVIIESGFGPTYKHQETITYACKEGYELVGARVITCGADNKFSPQPPTCELIITCQRPTTSENVIIESGFGPTYKYQDTITYTCKEGYELFGARVIICGADNKFSPQPPTCELIITCQRPTTSENVIIESGFGPTYKYQDTITYTCKEGYELFGARVIICGADKKFSPQPPTCELTIGCDGPTTSENVIIESGFGPTYKYQETIIYTCKEGYELIGARVITCGADNKFSPQPPSCKLTSKPDGLSNGTKIGLAVSFSSVGAICLAAVGYYCYKKSKRKSRNMQMELRNVI
ncbi:C4b-binding protein alpha chain-like [Narcine bancroftii]|uniref:C4b-binding protein alpha chain-like n=1 Tax=Narcine bancroftii TaxID=1343680 RepID=UPI0038314271